MFDAASFDVESFSVDSFDFGTAVATPGHGYANYARASTQRKKSKRQELIELMRELYDMSPDP